MITRKKGVYHVAPGPAPGPAPGVGAECKSNDPDRTLRLLYPEFRLCVEDGLRCAQNFVPEASSLHKGVLKIKLPNGVSMELRDADEQFMRWLLVALWEVSCAAPGAAQGTEDGKGHDNAD